MNAGPFFVAGATGLTGRAVVQTLRARDAQVLPHVRPESPQRAAWEARFAALGASTDTTPWDAEAFASRFASLRPRVVFACLGTTRARARQAAREGRSPATESYAAVDVGMTRMLIEAARGAGVQRFVYLSSIGADPRGNAYLAARAEVEETLRRSGVPFSIARPSLILGDRDVKRPFERTIGRLADGTLGVLGSLGARTLRDRYRSIESEDLARALVQLAVDPAWENRTAEGEHLQALAAASRDGRR